MKLASFSTGSEGARIGIVLDGGVIDVAAGLPHAPRDMTVLMTDWSTWQAPLQALAARPTGLLNLESIRLLAPVARPGKIFAIGLNYADHIAESNIPQPAEQVWFTKAVTAINAPHGDIELPRVSTQLDYEAELAFVIGQRCRHVSAEEAPGVIFGYCAANDVSVRDWQLRTSQFVIGKSFDTHCPYGPWIVTADEIGDPHTLGIRSFVNGELRQSSNTRELIYNCYAQVAQLSQAMTLEPGDLILTGTPGGVGLGFKPPRWLVAGDVVRVEIDRIGALENRVEPERT
ncbi:MAG: fumarylacetoacetate hydrolase family protein [Polaromonas sp.]|nr:fumarylacetoacetate hydrolase family protein [Polaromonas sp.]